MSAFSDLDRSNPAGLRVEKDSVEHEAFRVGHLAVLATEPTRSVWEVAPRHLAGVTRQHSGDAARGRSVWVASSSVMAVG